MIPLPASLFARLLGVSLMVCGLWSVPAKATDPTRTLAQLQHTGLRAEDGAPADISAMAQTEDGWLWLSTRGGLFRYDGFAFERVPLLPPGSNQTNATWTLYAAPGGDLWVSMANGGLARVRQGKVTLFGEAQGLPHDAAVDDMKADGEGHLWAATEVGTYRLEGDRWSRVGRDWGLDGNADQIFEDGRGGLWVLTSADIYRLAPGGHHFEATGLGNGKESELLRGPQGRILMRGPGGIRQLPAPWGEPHATAPSRRANGSATLFDLDGNVWTVACHNDLCRGPWQDAPWTAPQPVAALAPQTFTEAQGLTSQATMQLLEDRDGHVWVSTKMGLDRFRDSWLARARFPTAEGYFALVEDGQGRVWSGTASRSSHRDHLWQLTPEPVPLPDFEGETDSTLRDTDGSVWLGGPGTLRHMRDGHPQPVALPKGAAEKGTIVQAMARDGEGRLWLSLRSVGVFVQSGDDWLPAASIAPLPEPYAFIIHIDPQGRPWFGYLDGTVALLDGSTVSRFGSDEGLGFGPVTAVATAGGHLVVASEQALSVFDGTRFRRIASRQSGLFDAITGIVEGKDGTVWAYGNSGVLRFDAAHWKAVVTDPSVPVDVQPLTMEEGLAGPAQLVRPLPTALAASDGRLWFAGSQGLAWLDPTRRPAAPSAPPVLVRGATSGGRPLAAGTPVTLRTSRDLVVAYTALAPGYPHGVVFRYRLDGEDSDWHDAGTRREAAYARLRPGQYTFRVEASYDRLQWSQAAPVSIDVVPTFTEMLPFKLLCLLLIAVAIWLAHRWRVRRLTAELRVRMSERHDERERIARDLHDTLLQGTQGLVLRFQALVDRLPTNDASRQALEKAIDRAEDLLVEGRDRVQGLRAGTAAGADLDERLGMLVHDMDADVVFRVSGKPRRMNGLVQEEVYSIVREALGNALQHSGAHSVVVLLDYSRRAVVATVLDDGIGFDATAAVAVDQGHFGLIGMRERAAHISARLEIHSARDDGTSVQVTVPARVAYLRHRAVAGARRH